MAKKMFAAVFVVSLYLMIIMFSEELPAGNAAEMNMMQYVQKNKKGLSSISTNEQAAGGMIDDIQRCQVETKTNTQEKEESGVGEGTDPQKPGSDDECEEKPCRNIDAARRCFCDDPCKCDIYGLIHEFTGPGEEYGPKCTTQDVGYDVPLPEEVDV